MAKSTDTEKTSQAVNDAYTGMLIVALVALLAAGVLVFLDYSRHSEKPTPVSRTYQPTLPGQNGATPKAPDQGQ